MAAARAAALGTDNEELTTSSGLSTSELHVWTVALGAAASAPADLLSAAERERAARFKHRRDADRYLAAHGALRRILSTYTGAPPGALEFRAGEHGKPSLVGPFGGIEFNLADADDLALIGVARSPLGIDLEALYPMHDLDDVAADHFSDAELAALRALPQAERLAGFYRCWTRKEAFIKALGEGLSHPLKSFSVSLAPKESSRVDGWTVEQLDPAPGFIGAWAMRGSPAIRLRPFGS